MACRTKRVKSRQRKVPSWPAPRSAACESEDSDGERRNQAVAASPSTTNTTSEIRIGDIKGNATTGAEDYSPCRVDTPPSARSRRRKCPPVRESQRERATLRTGGTWTNQLAGASVTALAALRAGALVALLAFAAFAALRGALAGFAAAGAAVLRVALAAFGA